MAYYITEDCIACGACVDGCPVQAISPGDPIYVIDPEKCVECVTFFEESQCASVCPVNCCLPDPNHKESREELEAKAKRLKG